MYVVLRSCSCNSEILRERKRADPVKDTEVDSLGCTSLCRSYILIRNSEHFPCGESVDIGRLMVSVLKPFVSGQVSHQTKLDLRIVGVNKHAAVRRDKCLPDISSELRSRRNVLHVRIGRTEASGRRYRLSERRVDPSVVRNVRVQTVRVCGIQFRVLTVLKHLRNDRMLSDKLLEDLRRSRVFSLRLLRIREFQLFKQYFAELLRRIQVKFTAGHLMHGGAGFLHLDAEHRGERTKLSAVNADPGLFHVSQHPH